MDVPNTGRCALWLRSRREISRPDRTRLERRQQKQQQAKEEDVRSMCSVEEGPRSSTPLREGGGARRTGGKHQGAGSNHRAGGWREQPVVPQMIQSPVFCFIYRLCLQSRPSNGHINKFRAQHWVALCHVMSFQCSVFVASIVGLTTCNNQDEELPKTKWGSCDIFL